MVQYYFSNALFDFSSENIFICRKFGHSFKIPILYSSYFELPPPYRPLNEKRHIVPEYHDVKWYLIQLAWNFASS